MVLDEPTSEMDARGEHQIFLAVRRIAPERIAVFVTHQWENVASPGVRPVAVAGCSG